MKARNFRYVRPASLQEAYRMLAEAGGEAVPIAGGQSLLAGLNMRLSSPQGSRRHRQPGRADGSIHADGMVRLGALTRHRDLLSSAIVRAHLPLLAEAAPHIGHIAIRNRGTSAAALPMPTRRRNCRPARSRSAPRWCWAAPRASAR